MKDLLNYVYQAVRAGQLPKAAALELLRRLHQDGGASHDFSGAPVSQLPTPVSGLAPDPVVSTAAAELTGQITLVPAWVPVAVPGADPWPLPAERVAVVGGEGWQRIRELYPDAHSIAADLPIDALPMDYEELLQRLRDGGAIDHLFVCISQQTHAVTDEAMLEQQARGVLTLFRLAKALLALGYAERTLGITVITVRAQALHHDECSDATHAAVHGLVGSLAKEQHRWRLRLIDVASYADLPLELLTRIPADPDGNAWLHRDGELYRQRLQRWIEPPAVPPAPYREAGVYVVIGGAGGIGEAFSEYLVRNYRAQLIWIGRSARTATIDAKITRLGALGPAPRYVQADATDRAALTQAYREIKDEFARIDAVVHSAVGLLDQSIAAMSEAYFAEVLSAKITLSVRLAQVFAAEASAAFIFFSSLNSFTKDSGKSGYSAGCVFADSYAQQLARGTGRSVKVMNWGYWGDVGIGSGVPAVFKNRLARSGIGALETASAMQALATLLAAPMSSAACVHLTDPQAAVALGIDAREWCYTQAVAAPRLTVPYACGAPPAELSDPAVLAESAALDTLAATLLLAQFRALGIAAAGRLQLDAWLVQTPRATPHRRWLSASVARLLASGLLQNNGEEITYAERELPATTELWQQWAERSAVWSQLSALRADVQLMQVTLRALPEILRGERAATDVMFPNSSLALVENVYRNNPRSDYFNTALAAAARAYVDARLAIDSDAPLKILEIGAGTGSTSAAVFEALAEHASHIAEYCYTDLSRAFLLHAEQHFGPRVPYLKYQLFDAERAAAAQGIQAGSYDLVIATNVLHATRDIRTTLAHAKELLKCNGVLLLNEMAANPLMAHLTFGLLEGWWRHEDAALRIAHSPLLSSAAWQRVLEHSGFGEVQFPALAAHTHSQQIVVACSDGVVRGSDGAAPRTTPQPQSDAPRCQRSQPAARDAATLRARALDYVRNVLGTVLKIPVAQIDVRESFEHYGIDSILVVQLTEALRDKLPGLSSALFFEHRSIAALVDFFLESHAAALRKLVGLDAVASPAAPELVPPPRSERTQRAPMRVNDAAVDRRIAIIGMSGRYPQAETLEQYWDNLASGRDCVTEIPAERWSLDDFYVADPDAAVAGSKSYSKWGGFIAGFDEFDPQFFSIAPREAISMDPQERLFLQYCWAAMEDAGYTRELFDARHQGRVGVFAGVTRTGFELFGPELWRAGSDVMPNTSFSSIANRVSYLFDLKGPSLPIDTMCSASLTALHEACEHLLRGECELAFAGGVNLYLHPSSYVGLSRVRMLSPDGRCRSFGHGGNGFVPAEGVGVVLLKPLQRAIADGDQIHAVIRATSINHGGRTHGYTVPNPTAQRELVRSALAKAQLGARALSCIEAHGTGTELGDPIEIAGLSQAFASDTSDRQFCAIGSVKSSIGHAEAAAGIAALTKVILQLKHRMLVPSLHAAELNPHLALEQGPFVVQRELAPWSPPGSRIAGVSSFGAGGANAHVILEEWLQLAPTSVAALRPALIVLSARTEAQLQEQVARLHDALVSGTYSEEELERIAYTLQTGREAMEHRLAMAVFSVEELQAKLAAASDAGAVGVLRGSVRPNKAALASLADDADFEQTLAAWVAHGKFDKLLELWVKGLSIDWSCLYPGTRRPQRISLPTYPFARERYWLPLTTSAPPAASPPAVQLTPSEPAPLLSFEEYWRIAAAGPGIAMAQPSTLVVFLSQPQSQRAFMRAWQQLDAQARVVFVAQQDSAGQAEAQHYRVSSADPATFAATLRAIQQHHGVVDGILYLWAVEDAARVADTQSLVHLIQALVATQLPCPRVLLAASVQQDLERCHAESWIGFQRSLRASLPQSTLSVVIEASATALEECVPRWHQELQQSDAAAVLYRDGVRHQLSIRECQLALNANGLLRQQGNYLITGGAGGLGLLFAEHLARAYDATVTLVGRSALDAERRTRLEQLQRAGRRVRYLPADVCDEAQLREVIAASGELHGVIHAAGIEGTDRIVGKSAEQIAAVLAPKVAGTVALERALSDQTPDFVCYFSSSAAILGDAGSCDYAVGNRFQMAYARARNVQGAAGRRIAINWPLWRDGGMGFKEDSAAARLYLKSSGQRALTGPEGIEVFERVLGAGLEQCLIIAGQRERVQRFLGLTREAAPAASPDQPRRRREQPRRRAELRGLTLIQCAEWELRELAGELLQLPQEKLDTQENLADLGFDSISLAQLAKRLTERLGIVVVPSLFFSHPTLRQLAEHFQREHAASLQRLYGDAQSVEFVPVQAVPVEPATVRPEPPRAAVVPVTAASASEEPIAIIGMSGRFPDANDVAELWQLLLEGREAVREIPSERFDWREIYDPTGQPGKSCGKWLGALSGVAEFDPLFFEITPREAETMDPRQRLLLQEAFRALEDAGCGTEESRNVGVFVGVEQGDFGHLLQGAAGLTATNDAVLAARLSYFLNLRGPALALNTACSSGLVAVHQACMSLRAGECDAAVAASVNVLLTPRGYVEMTSAGMLSADGKCYAFDERANGMVPGEAVVAVVLKRLSRAEADGDRIHAVIRGSGINYDGRTNGITAPSGGAQQELIRQVQQRAGVRAEQVSYVVTHGTGTRLGDPVEINALDAAFRTDTTARGFCALTSSKTNLGHTFAASGLVSLVSLVQALRHQMIPPSLHCERESDYIDWANSACFVNKTQRAWSTASNAPRLGAVSSFGMSGTNAHVLVQEYASPVLAGSNAPCVMLALSAKTTAALQQRIADLLHALQSREWNPSELRAMSWSLLTGRQHFKHRCAVVVMDGQHARAALQALSSQQALPNVFNGVVAREFNGQQALRGYAQDLLEQLGAERQAADQYQQSLQALAQMYCQGYALHWPTLFGARPPQRMSLPGYPFAKERYWVSTAAARPAPVLVDAPPQQTLAAPAQLTTVVFGRQWREEALRPSQSACTRRWVLLNEGFDAALLQASDVQVEVLLSSPVLSEQVESSALQVLQRVQQLLSERDSGAVRVQVVLSASAHSEALSSALSGLLKSAALENPKLSGQVIELTAPVKSAELCELLRAEAGSLDAQVRYLEGERQVLQLGTHPVCSDARRPWRAGGVYWISGGAGGLGLIVARAIVKCVPDAKLILSGRSEVTSKQVQSLAVNGAQVEYLRVDVSDAQAVRECVAQILARHGALHGVVHCAGVVRDSFILKKELGQCREVLAGKVAGTVNLDEATSEVALDFFIGFSSVSGVLGNVGQADYACGNGFLDGYLQYRQTLVSRGERSGRSLAIAWPLWAEGGMSVDGATLRELQRAGFEPLSESEGLAALYQAYGSAHSRAVVLCGTSGALGRVLGQPSSAAASVVMTEVAEPALRERTLQRLVALFSAVTKLSPERIELNEPLESYGIDSLLIVQLNAQLSEQFGELSKTLFYEYPTLGELGEYLLREHRAACVAGSGLVSEAPAVVSAAPITAPAAPVESKVTSHVIENEPIAIIGMSGRYPQASNLEQYWENLKAGRDCIGEIPAQRWNVEAFYEPSIDSAIEQGKSYSKWGGFIADFAQFDPLFFNISPREALLMDPQERLFLQTSWEVLEDAGYTRARLSQRHGGRVGVYAGITKIGYHTNFSSVANRVSYLLDLKGPSMPIDTMCSASLTAIHEACEHLRRGECELAIVGGVNLYLQAQSYVDLCSQRMLSAQGQCKSYGQGSNGFVPGEGVGAVLLKPLSAAQADGDHIYALIRATSINHGGKTNGYTVPNPNAQRELVRKALVRAGLNARQLSYIEGHGTGTALGDPIEITGLKQAFEVDTDEKGFCALGSVKSNIGHLEAAAGIAGLTKIVLQMRHRTLVPSLHVEQLNEHIDFADTPFVVQRELGAWEVAAGQARLAGISSFGAGGANAHVIVQEYCAEARPSTASRPALVVLSGKSEERLRAQAQRLLEHVRRHPESNLSDIAYTLQVGREAMEHRLGLLASSLEQLSEQLTQYLSGASVSGVYRGEVKKHKEVLGLLNDEAGLQGMLAQWMAQARWGKLLELWTRGAQLPWEQLYVGTPPRRIPLPTYAFAEESYWHGDAPAAPVARAVAAPAHCLTFVEQWQCDELPPTAAADIDTLLCFIGAGATELRAALTAIDPRVRVITVAAGAEFIRYDADSYAIAPDRPDDHVQLLQYLKHHRIDAVWYLWPLETGAHEPRPITHLIQALGTVGLPCPRILLAAQPRDAQESCHAQCWIGFERSLRQVLPATELALIAERSAAPIDLGAWTQRLWSEQHAARLESVLYDGARQVLRNQPQTLGQAGIELRHGGVYLISGGLGGLGYAFARHLAEHYAARLILLGRSPLGAQQRTQLASLEALGAEPTYICVDVCDPAALATGLGAARQRFGTLHGVIHAAGIESSSSILTKEPAAFAAVLAPKITGTVALDRVLAEEPLDFVCYFSSSAAILGDFGGCDYAIGNRFQMAYARYRNQERRAGRRSGHTLAINWPLWRDGGMGFKDRDSTALYLQASGQSALTTPQGVELFERILAEGLEQCLVMCGQPERIQRVLAPRAAARPVISATTSVATAATTTVATGQSLTARVLADLHEQVAAVLQLPVHQQDPTVALAEFGFDSISLAQFAERLSRHYGLRIVPSVFFSHPSLRQLAEHLAVEHAAPLGSFYGEAAAEPMVEAEAVLPTPANVPAPNVVQPVADAGVDEPIAIIGMSGRFPGAANVTELWQVLTTGRTAVQEIALPRTAGALLSAPGSGRWLGALADVARFDAMFFEITPREAELMDPRQRLLLEESFKALEDAGYGQLQLDAERIGMFVGVEQGDYQMLTGERSGITGNHEAVLASRLSYFLDLQGPALALNTACSSGLVALHQACSALRMQECSTAIAAGVSLLLTEQSYEVLSRAGVLSSEGKCYAFDRRANGMVPGEAVVAVVLKRLSQARADGDPIHAVIRASGLNYDGKTNGITAPSGAAQSVLITETYERARLDARDIEYIVTHGTGTRLGDPVEINALAEVFKRAGGQPASCALTSSKTNFGHTFAASGLVSLVSLVQALRHELIPASLHCEEQSDYVDWQDNVLFVNHANRAWPMRAGQPRLGAVSAFGVSGTNAHVVVASYEPPVASPLENTRSRPWHCDGAAALDPGTVPSVDAAPSSGGARPGDSPLASEPCFLLALSAKSAAALENKARDLLAVLASRSWDAGALRAMSHTLLNGRQHFRHRCALVVASQAQAQQLLEQLLAQQSAAGLYCGVVARQIETPPSVQEQAAALLAELAARPEPEQFQRALQALAQLYCEGHALHWPALFAPQPPQRIALPTYPFADEHYWVPAAESVEQPASAPRNTRRDQLASLLDAVIAGRIDLGVAARTTEQIFDVRAKHELH